MQPAPVIAFPRRHTLWQLLRLGFVNSSRRDRLNSCNFGKRMKSGRSRPPGTDRQGRDPSDDRGENIVSAGFEVSSDKFDIRAAVTPEPPTVAAFAEPGGSSAPGFLPMKRPGNSPFGHVRHPGFDHLSEVVRRNRWIEPMVAAC